MKICRLYWEVKGYMLDNGGYMVLKTKKYKSKENLNLHIYTFVFGNI